MPKSTPAFVRRGPGRPRKISTEPSIVDMLMALNPEYRLMVIKQALERTNPDDVVINGIKKGSVVSLSDEDFKMENTQRNDEGQWVPADITNRFTVTRIEMPYESSSNEFEALIADCNGDASGRWKLSKLNLAQ